MTNDAHVVRLTHLVLMFDCRNGDVTIKPRTIDPRQVTLTLSAAEFEQLLLPLVAAGAAGDAAPSPTEVT